MALAERLELLLSIYAKGERPTGSSDPYALRRAGNGLLQILWDRGWRLDLLALLQRSCAHWASLFPHFAINPEALAAELAEFLRQRLVSLLEEGGLDGDLVQAVAGPGLPLERVLGDPEDARRRATLLGELRHTDQLPGVLAVVQRASRLAAKGDLDHTVLSPEEVVDTDLFESPVEMEMREVLRFLAPIALRVREGDYTTLAVALANSAKTLSAFFDGPDSVLVMADDPAVRRNRLNLLAVLRNQAALLADFERISGS